MDGGKTRKEMIVEKRNQKVLKKHQKKREGHALIIDVRGYDNLIRFFPFIDGECVCGGLEK